MILLMLVYIGQGLLFMALSVPMIQGKVKRNPWYGFRTAKTLSSDRVWYAANAYSGRTMFLAGLATSLAAILLAPFAAIPAVGLGGYNLLCLAVLIGSLLWSVVKSFQYLSKL